MLVDWGGEGSSTQRKTKLHTTYDVGRCRRSRGRQYRTRGTEARLTVGPSHLGLIMLHVPGPSVAIPSSPNFPVSPGSAVNTR